MKVFLNTVEYGSKVKYGNRHSSRYARIHRNLLRIKRTGHRKVSTPKPC